MTSEKIVSIAGYRKEQDARKHNAPKVTVGLLLPSADRLWELLDRNISIAVWRERNCA